MAYPPGTHARTIPMPEDRSRAIRFAATWLGISGRRFIDDAITEHLRATYEAMINDLP